ncbi:MAG: hypothetical protein JO026_02580 [Patescibacteria group bacterium]|nr:hypothetical protein [Patescibacteria group bacterium]
MNTQFKLGIIVLLLIVGGGSFYGGMVYARHTARSAFGARGAGGPFAAGQFGGRGTRAGVNGTAGSIITKDATSVTIKLPDGSTKIVLFGTETQVMKQAAGTVSDLSIGENVLVNGSANSDGSITASAISVRPAGQRPGGAAARTQ